MAPEGSRAAGRGSRRLRSASIAVGAGIAAAAVAGVIAAALPGPHARALRYGRIPSWLPKATVPVGRVVTATEARPWLAIQGDTVRVILPHGRVTVTAVGPAVPEEGRFPVPRTSRCRFTVTFSSVAGAVPLRAQAFSFTDEVGHVHRRFRMVAGPRSRLPEDVLPRHTVTVTITTVLPTGSGKLNWSPDGGRTIVSWDYSVEID